MVDCTSAFICIKCITCPRPASAILTILSKENARAFVVAILSQGTTEDNTSAIS